MTPAPALRLGALVTGLLLASAASAANEYQSLLRAKKYAEVDKAAAARLAQDPNNADALVARTAAILSMDDTRVDEAVGLAEKCVAIHPNNGACHLALGQSLGTKAMIKGIMASLGSAGTIRDSLKKAVALNPGDIDARFTMLDFYMMAPFVVGGGKGKAETFIKETSAVLPEAGKLMAARMIASDDLGKAEAAALAIRPGADEELQERHEGLLTMLGARHMQAKAYPDADRVLREAQKRYPNSDDIAYMLGRLQQEQGKHREAVAALEQVASKMPRPYVHYRLGKSLQALGEKAKAVSAYEKAIGAKSGLPQGQRADAAEQLKALRG